jgi:hypothetical protein
LFQQPGLDQTKLEGIPQRQAEAADVMKLEMRQKLAREPFAEKFRKVG